VGFRKDFNWHFGQLSNLGEDYTQTVRNYLLGGEQWQYMDMDRRQLGQHPVKPNDWTPGAALSDGSSSQVFFTKYPPLESGSLRLWVWVDAQNREEWHPVTDLSEIPGSRLWNPGK